MSATTGPILAAGGIVAFNAIIVHNRPAITQTRVVVGTIIAAGGFHLLEKAAPSAAVGMAWLVLVATLLVRADPATPAPIESFGNWYNTK